LPGLVSKLFFNLSQVFVNLSNQRAPTHLAKPSEMGQITRITLASVLQAIEQKLRLLSERTSI
jgi:hypothetical protein